jgi:hypothetical protein
MPDHMFRLMQLYSLAGPNKLVLASSFAEPALRQEGASCYKHQMSFIHAAKALAKKSAFLYVSYKLARRLHGSIPLSKWRNLEQIGAVFRILSNTVVTFPRLFDAYDAVIAINREGIPGDIVECGVWSGGCAGLMGLANLRNPGPPRRLHLFDSFEGLPIATLPDTTFPDRVPQWSPIATGKCVGISKNEVERFLVGRLGLDQSTLIFHEGWFQDTVPAATLEKILLRLDGDLYESTKVYLEHLFSKVSDGGYVIIDDCRDFPACKRATDEFFPGIGMTPVWIWFDRCCVYSRK